jgi:uncharacterized protein YkwD|tara:strand:+ start:1442 stop:2518 length:1077 start_codon:yes stop_codon:yes gene_type:complete
MIFFGQCDRQQIAENYNTIYLGSQVLPAQLGWTGDVITCNPGTISTLSLDNTLDRINYFRDLVGLPSNITFDPLLNQKCQEAALMMDANNSVNHNPPPTWLCYTTNGDDAAGSSNLASGSNSSSSITRYISDHGVNNTAVGHRRRILYTRANIFGTGSTYTKNALWVINNFITPAPVPFVAYPSPGFFPGPLVFGRWSFSIQNADFSLTTISMTNEQGINIPLTIEPITNGYGDNTIVWVPDPSYINNLFGSEDTKYTINILNVNNTIQQNYNYEIVIMTHNNGGNLVHPPNCPNLTIWNEDSCACINQTTSIYEVNHKTKTLQKVTNILGKEKKGRKNELLFYIYDDGTVEKRIIIE